MAISLLKAKTKVPTKSLLSCIARLVRDQDHCYGARRNLMTIAWNNENSFSGSLPVSHVYKPESEPVDLRTLKEKEKCDWRLLTLEEKRMLYDMSVSHPFHEVSAPEAEWKSILAGTFLTMGLMTLGIYAWHSHYAYMGLVDGLPTLEVQHPEFTSNFIEHKEMDSSFDCNSRH